MSKDAWQSLIAWGSVISIIGLILLSREFVEGIEVPAWLGLIGLSVGYARNALPRERAVPSQFGHAAIEARADGMTPLAAAIRQSRHAHLGNR
jgi:hypothetical protein